jgi:hypothetical protein
LEKQLIGDWRLRKSTALILEISLPIPKLEGKNLNSRIIIWPDNFLIKSADIFPVHSG